MSSVRPSVRVGSLLNILLHLSRLPKHMCILRYMSWDRNGHILFLAYLQWVWFHCCCESLAPSNDTQPSHLATLSLVPNTLPWASPSSPDFWKQLFFSSICSKLSFGHLSLFIGEIQGCLYTGLVSWSLALAVMELCILIPSFTSPSPPPLCTCLNATSQGFHHSLLWHMILSSHLFKFFLHKRGCTLVLFALIVNLASKEEQIQNGNSKGV